MMSRLALCILLLCFNCATYAQGVLPKRDAIAIGGGITLPIDKGEKSFVTEHRWHPLFMADASYRHFFSQEFAVGVLYDFNAGFKSHDYIRTHYVAPTVTWRYLEEPWMSFYASFAIGYLSYSDKVTTRPSSCDTNKEGYLATCLTIGVEWAWSKYFSSQFHLDYLNANWGQNENFGDGGYDSDQFFESKLSYITIGISLQFAIR